MKVKLEMSIDREGHIVVMLRKGKNKDEMHTGQVVGFYAPENEKKIKMLIEDVNIAFDGMWHE